MRRAQPDRESNPSVAPVPDHAVRQVPDVADRRGVAARHAPEVLPHRGEVAGGAVQEFRAQLGHARLRRGHPLFACSLIATSTAP